MQIGYRWRSIWKRTGCKTLFFREEDFRTERMVVMEERRLRTEDNPQAVLIEQVMATAFQIQPYRWPIIGWMEDIARFTLDDLKTYYKTYYNPVNTFLVVVGDFKKEELLAKIEKAFGSYPKGVAPEQEKDIDPPQMGERRIFVKKEAQLPFLVMGYHVPNLREPDSYVLEIIATILSGGKSSRLYQSLVREKRLVLSADADHSSDLPRPKPLHPFSRFTSRKRGGRSGKGTRPGSGATPERTGGEAGTGKGNKST